MEMTAELLSDVVFGSDLRDLGVTECPR
jgi:hypothetical protein